MVILDRKQVLEDIKERLFFEDDSKLAEVHSVLIKDHKTEYDENNDAFVQNEVDWLTGLKS